MRDTITGKGMAEIVEPDIIESYAFPSNRSGHHTFECPEREVEQIKHLMREMMTTAGKLRVLLEVDIKQTSFSCDPS
jgi:hypothetical protein